MTRRGLGHRDGAAFGVAAWGVREKSHVFCVDSLVDQQPPPSSGVTLDPSCWAGCSSMRFVARTFQGKLVLEGVAGGMWWEQQFVPWSVGGL